MADRELEEQMSSFGAGLAQLGLRRGDKVSLFSENSARWLIADQAVMMNGAADAVSSACIRCGEGRTAGRCVVGTSCAHQFRVWQCRQPVAGFQQRKLAVP